MGKRSAGAAAILKSLNNSNAKSSVPVFRAGDAVKVHARIVEGNKERIQIFQGVVICRKGRNGPTATFTVRKVSYNVGVERVFLLHSPRIDKIEVLNSGIVRRAKLFYLRDIKGKAGKIRSKLLQSVGAEVLTGGSIGAEAEGAESADSESTEGASSAA